MTFAHSVRTGPRRVVRLSKGIRMRTFALVSTAFAVAALLAPAGAARAQDLPTMKPGQWEMTSASTKAGGGANPPVKTTMCTDAAMQRELIAMGAGMSRDMCTKNEFKRDGSKIVTTAECKIGDSKIVSRAVMTLTGDTGYRTEISATYDPPFMGMKDSKSTIEGKYVGPCRDGLVPGDFIMPGGQKVNMKAMLDRKAAMPPPMPGAPKSAPAAPKAPAPAK
jgi:hypothetical protein